MQIWTLLRTIEVLCKKNSINTQQFKISFIAFGVFFGQTRVKLMVHCNSFGLKLVKGGERWINLSSSLTVFILPFTLYLPVRQTLPTPYTFENIKEYFEGSLTNFAHPAPRHLLKGKKASLKGWYNSTVVQEVRIDVSEVLLHTVRVSSHYAWIKE